MSGIDAYDVDLKIDFYVRNRILGLINGGDLSNILVSIPPAGKKRITNIYYDPSTGSIEVDVQ